MRNIEVPLSIQLPGGPSGSLPLRWRHYNVEAIIDFHYRASIRAENIFRFKRCLKRAVVVKPPTTGLKCGKDWIKIA
jgi:hypothetical protein